MISLKSLHNRLTDCVTVKLWRVDQTNSRTTPMIQSLDSKQIEREMIRH